MSTTVCRLDDLVVELGVAALLEVEGRQEQVALFRLADDSVHAVQNLDPFSGATVLARGLVGTHTDEELGLVDEPILSSPMYKQVWSLATGECLDAQGKEPLPITVYPVEVVDGEVRVG